jgi:3-hydroxy-9,10-secoandrosta-1,3,5(10)-triene-9,17-dione monooxygenase reductase component
MTDDVLSSDPAGTIPAATFKRVMSRFPTGVVVVATSCAGRLHGMTVNSFTSVSLDPLLLLFCASRTSTTWPYLRVARRFAVSVLGAGQEEAGRVFADRGDDRFGAVSWSYNRSGQPILDDAIAWFDCAIEGIVVAGDHDIVVGRVLDAQERPDGDPLCFHRGRFQALTGPAAHS